MMQIKKFLSKFDMFSSSPTLRAEGQSQVVNVCGGVFSIIIFTAFMQIFASSIISTINLQQISATQIAQRSRSSDQKIGNITIAVGLHKISRQNLTAIQHIFQVRAFISDRYLRQTQIDVFPCKRQFFLMLDDTSYQTLGIDTHLCLQKDDVYLLGEFGSPQAQFILFNLSICNNATSRVTCASPTDIDNYLATHMFWGRFMVGSMIIIDTGLNPTKQNPYTYSAYEKTLFLLFNLKQQMFIQTFVGTYEVITDTSFLPFVQQKREKGYYVQQCAITTIINYLNIPVFIQSYIFPSPMHRKIQRTYGKIDDVLSYVGGLYGIVVSFFAFFLLSFNEYKYELRVSQGAFTFKDGHLAKQSDLNFLKYLKYVAYDWIKTLTCHQLRWNDCKAIDEARQQAIQQIDVKHLLQRITHLQKAMASFVNPEGQKILYMSESHSLQQAKSRRGLIQYCDKFRNSDKSLTISLYQTLQAVVSYSLNNLTSTQENLNNIVHPYATVQNLQKTSSSNFKEMEQSSLQIMSRFLRQYIQKYNINEDSFELSQQDLKAEQQLAQAFFKLDQATRKKQIRKIPLGILYRMQLSKNRSQAKNQTGEIYHTTQNNYMSNPNPVIEQVQSPEFRVNKRHRRKQRKLLVELESMDNTLQLAN